MHWLRRVLGGPAQPPYAAGDSPPELAADLIETEQMAAELVDYLLGNRLFRQIVVETPAGPRRPKMTLGGLYERIQALSAAAALGPGDRRRLAQVVEAWEAARRRYPDQVQEKVQRELQSFLQSWKYYLAQRATNPERWQEEYEVESRNRQRVLTVLRLLGPAAPAGLIEDLAALEEESVVSGQ
ncbi:MAG: hypothetical protein HUU23_01930 [Caldilineales bacterium]|nr:hypothetical protein [Caldilineales bacterium]